MADPAGAPRPIDYGDAATRPSRRWAAVGGVARGLSAVLLIGCSLLVLLAGLTAAELAWPRRQFPPPRPLTAAEAGTVLATLRPPAPLTPAQLATLRRHLQAPGQLLVETRPEMPFQLSPPTVRISRSDASAEVLGTIDDGSGVDARWTVTADGRALLATTRFANDDDAMRMAGTADVQADVRHAYGRPARCRVAVLATVALALDVALFRWLAVLAGRIAWGSAPARRWAASHAVLSLLGIALAAAATVTLFAMNRLSTGPSPHSRSAIANVVLAALLLAAFPAALLIAVRRSKLLP